MGEEEGRVDMQTVRCADFRLEKGAHMLKIIEPSLRAPARAQPHRRVRSVSSVHCVAVYSVSLRRLMLRS